MINVSELITDPDFSQTITVIRRKTAVENYRNTVEESQFTVPAVISVNQDATTQNREGYTQVSEKIDVFVNGYLYYTGDNGSNTPVGSGYLSDVVLFEGNRYEVIAFSNYVQYGYGRATCVRLSQR